MSCFYLLQAIFSFEIILKKTEKIFLRILRFFFLYYLNLFVFIDRNEVY